MVHTNTTHELYVCFYFLLLVSVIYIDLHQVGKHRYRRKSATEEASPSQSVCYRYIRYYSQKRNNKKGTIKTGKSIEFFHNICTKIQNIINIFRDVFVLCIMLPLL
jgi:hypothetical protein